MDTKTQNNDVPQGLTLQQLQSMGAKPVQPTGGLTSDQLTKMGAKPNFDQSMTALSHSQTTLDNLQQQATQAKQTADQAASPIGIAAETTKEAGSSLIDNGLKFVGSALKAPADIVNNLLGRKGTDTNAVIPGIGGMQQSFQGEFGSKTIPNVESGAESPLAATAGTVGGVLGGAADVLGAKGLGEMVAKPVTAAADATKSLMEQQAEKQSTQTAIKALTPKMTPSEISDAAKAGQVKNTLLGGSKVDMSSNPLFMRMVDATKGIVKGKSVAEDIGNVKTALSNEAESLKSQVSGADHPYVFKELQSRLNNVEEPISLRGTPFEKQIGPIKQAAIDIAKKNGGTISGLLDARKEFDTLVSKTYPHLYDSDSAPIKNAITGIRNEMNNFIDDNLPDEAGFKQSLDKQRLYYDAIDNLSTKAPGEVKQGGIIKKTLGNPYVKGAAGLLGADYVFNKAKNTLGL